MERNIRKTEVLNYVNEHDQVTSSMLASELDLEVHNARMLLLNYHRQGLLYRTTEEGYKIYRLSEKGVDRMYFLESRFEA